MDLRAERYWPTRRLPLAWSAYRLEAELCRTTHYGRAHARVSRRYSTTTNPRPAPASERSDALGRARGHAGWRACSSTSRSTHLTIGHTHSQVNPGVAKIKTLLTTRREWRDVVDLIKVGALHRGLAAYPLEGKADALQQSHGRLLLSGPRVSHQQSPAWCCVSYGRCPS